jgi:hypothetical protein
VNKRKQQKCRTRNEMMAEFKEEIKETSLMLHGDNIVTFRPIAK